MASTTRIAQTFDRLQTEGQMAFMPFLTAGDPDLNWTKRLVRELAAAGVDLIELGFPYSDPIADGPVIQASYTRALERDVHVSDIFDAVRELTAGDSCETSLGAGPGNERAAATGPPIVAMVSYSIIFRSGPERFVTRAAESGVSGLIVPDLPADEADLLAPIAQDAGLDLVQLIAPTTPRERAERILAAASGFVYCISVAGTTGERDRLPDELTDQLRWLRSKTNLPLAVGFGISRPEHVEPLRGLADGVIVGSAIVRRAERLNDPNADSEQVLAEIGEFAGAMVRACHG
ncbi:MAG: tryptophan synthase subunit alpha [Planctomycetes bacterium]|nr:tryptophan synthase subunit alpha [Planctomycetota bacterium]